MGKRLGHFERNVLMLLTIHPSADTEDIARELERTESEVIRATTRLQDKGYLGPNLQPLLRGRIDVPINRESEAK